MSDELSRVSFQRLEWDLVLEPSSKGLMFGYALQIWCVVPDPVVWVGGNKAEF